MYKLKNKTSMPLAIQGNTVMGKGTLIIKIIDPQIDDLMQSGIVKVVTLKEARRQEKKKEETKEDKKDKKKDDKKDNII